MYKVFFNDRTIYLTDNFSKNFQEKYGLFFKYKEKSDLLEIIDLYANITKINSLIIFHYNIDELRDAFRSCFSLVDAAGGLVKNDKGEYLFIYRRGKWDLPKGKLDEKESYQQAAIREVQEETGLDKLELLNPMLSTYHTYPEKNTVALKKTYWFEMKYYGEELPVPQKDEDIEEVKWFKPDDLFIPFQNTYPLIKDLFRYIGIIS